MAWSDAPGSTRANGLAPVDNGRFGGAITSNARPGQQPHGLAERQAFIGGAALDRLELLERVGKSDVIDPYRR